ncbi:EAL domain-containing protein [Pseudomonas sp. sp1636]|uniref:putative bifunctional diguanylate cyclase/phosphodiesterase n=1 Tax=Pseudomonas sp. sp1636 TaxID=3036707 RepID=UPI0025A5BCCA|nr:GGDEF domain-containing phosphodiesterase [Pseudomonas sp. sp1636]MDM8349014.1 EAL domain-containing protein [Pseudomonas sp. sp1636]
MSLHQGAVRLTLTYLLAAGLWVFFGDALLAWLHLPAERAEQVQLLKGLCFVLLSSVLLYLILHSHLRQQARLRQTLRTSEERLSLALDSAQEGWWDWDLRSDKVCFSSGYTALLGLPAKTLDGTRARWLQQLHPDDRAEQEQALARTLQNASQEPHTTTSRMRHQDGDYRWIQSRGQLQLDAQGRAERFIGTASDISQRRANEHSLRQAAAVFDATQDGVLVTDSKQKIVHVNPAFTRITGYSPEEIIGRRPNHLSSGRHDRAFYQRLWHALAVRGSWSGEIWNRRKNGEIYPQWQRIRAIHDEQGAVSHYVAVFSDISALKRSQSELDHLAHHDPLSGLPNRLLFTERVENALKRAKSEQQGAVLLIDLDHFKHINESLGHNIGDLLLKAVGERLAAQRGEGMTLARLGGDEFGLLYEHCLDAPQAASLAQQLLSSLGAPFSLNGHEFYISASIGISLFPGDAENLDQVLRNADSALSKAKSSGREGYAFYTQELTEFARQRVDLISALHHALANHELRVYYQPLHELANGKLIGAEALVRWQHPQRGLVAPGEFIPIAEDSGLIGAIDAWVLEQACRQMVRWQAQAQAQAQVPRFVAVNVSSRLFSRGELDLQVAQVLAATGLDPACLELEVTESAVMDNPDAALTLLGRLRALGVRLAIDDFGTGYSSLARLKRLPVHKLKLDMSFVRGLPHDSDDVAITRAVVALGHSLDLKVLAEGIERPEQMAFLRQIGCDYGQGYLFGRPQPVESEQTRAVAAPAANHASLAAEPRDS